MNVEASKLPASSKFLVTRRTQRQLPVPRRIDTRSPRAGSYPTQPQRARSLERFMGLMLTLCALGCSDDTGSGLVQFAAYAAGPEAAVAGQPYAFDNAFGYHVVLERAQLTIGALYLNRSRPTLGAQDTPCILPGVYAAEVTSKLVIDALSNRPNQFATLGHGTADRALAGEVWLTGERVDATRDTTHILDYSGTASRQNLIYGFSGVITIDKNRALGSNDPATPGANPLCKQRIVTPIPIDITPSQGGQLTLRVRPEKWFEDVDFATLPGALGQGEMLQIPDVPSGQAAVALFQGIRGVNAYQFSWTDGAP